jgi:hypothetical protein
VESVRRDAERFRANAISRFSYPRMARDLLEALELAP